MKEKKPDQLKLLNDLLRQNPTYEAFADAVTKVTRRLIDEPRWKLERLRHHTPIHRGDFFDVEGGTGKVSVVRKIAIDPATNLPTTTFLDEVEIDLGNETSTRVSMRTMPERTLMKQNNAMLGFDFFSDKLSDADLQRIMRFVARYWPHSGDGNFVKFISYVKNTRFEMYQLVTPDYGDPDRDPSKDPYLYLERHQPSLETWTTNRANFDWSKDPIGGFGGVYPTSHVEFDYDILAFPEPDFVGTTELFYFLAPIHLVLQRFNASIHAPEFYFYSGAAGGFDNIHNSRYEWNLPNELTINANLMLVANFDHYASGQLILNDDFTNIYPLPLTGV